ncbi:TRAP transporter large permease [Thermodesulfobacteriota bacterium]
MSPIAIGFIFLIIFFALLAFGLSIGAGMAIIGFLGFWYLVSAPAAFHGLAEIPFGTISSYDFSVLPLFIFMAQIVFVSGLGKDLYNLAAKWLGHQPGGLAMATVGACGGFAAVSASSIATAATMGLVALPEMKKYNYDPALSTGCIAAGGTLGVLIPPSGGLILYGIITEESIGRLFMAGLVPGILEALFYMVTIYILCTAMPHYGPRGPRSSFKEKLMAFGSCGEIIGLIALVLGGLMIGWFTPTEAGAVGAFGALFFSLIRRRLSLQKFFDASLAAMKTTGMIFFILIGAFVFKTFLAVTTIPFWLADFVSGLPLPPMFIIVGIMVVWLFLGCFMDPAAMILLTVPIFFPLAMDLGFDPIWFGIIATRMGEIAQITPPVGINVYIMAGVAPEVPLQTIFKGIFPFLLADIFHVALLLSFPSITLFFPNLVM